MAIGTSQSKHIIYTHSFSSPIGTLHAAVDKLGRVISLGFTPIPRIPPGIELEENSLWRFDWTEQDSKRQSGVDS